MESCFVFNVVFVEKRFWFSINGLSLAELLLKMLALPSFSLSDKCLFSLLGISILRIHCIGWNFGIFLFDRISPLYHACCSYESIVISEIIWEAWGFWVCLQSVIYYFWELNIVAIYEVRFFWNLLYFLNFSHFIQYFALLYPARFAYVDCS